MWRYLLGVAAAVAFAWFAQRVRLLTTSGAIAASIIGSLALVVSWKWGALLVLYFVLAAALSRFGRLRKAERTSGIVAKEGPRDAAQVLANGGAFAAAALGAILWPHHAWGAFAVGSLAASEADTIATEVGTSIGGEPRALLTLRRVPTGTSGGVSVAGTVASLAGALYVVLVAFAFEVMRPDFDLLWRMTLAGFAGSLLDSVLGATVQSRRWCDACNAATERRIHSCGSRTSVAGGISWLDNDVVNVVSGVGGGLLAVILAR
jgi:uncharacterized protein (TIGR00297 family)